MFETNEGKDLIITARHLFDHEYQFLRKLKVDKNKTDNGKSFKLTFDLFFQLVMTVNQNVGYMVNCCAYETSAM